MIETTYVLHGRKANYGQNKKDIVAKIKLQDNQKINYEEIYKTARENGYTEFFVEWLLEELEDLEENTESLGGIEQ